MHHHYRKCAQYFYTEVSVRDSIKAVCRNRCKAKRLPGCDWTYYVYDTADRLIFAQDGEQRARGEWSFTIPDIFGRVSVSGTCKNTLNALSATYL